ncbi:GSAP protein, partial [Amia calva]|nr:GSAP protein [Amia calva]
MLHLRPTLDLRRDVMPHVLRKDEPPGTGEESPLSAAALRVVNTERDGRVLYCCQGASGNTSIGRYDPRIQQNKLLYTFDKEVCVSSASVNREATLLAVSLVQKLRRETHREPLRAGSKCLTLLIEIHPINNTKVLKAVDCRIRVQFLYPDTDKNSVHESHLLLISEDSYVEQFHINLVQEEGYRVVIQNPARIPKDKVAEDFSWAQWDAHTQRLFYLTCREKSVLKCVQFYPDCICETLFELPMDLPASPFAPVRFVNFGCDHYKDEELVADEALNLVVLTSNTGSMCICYSKPVQADEDVTYTVAFVHRGYSKTFTVAMEGAPRPPRTDLLFISLDYYIAVCLPGCFLHLINSRQPDLACHSLFLSGEQTRLCCLCPSSSVLSLPEAVLLEVHSGNMFIVSIKNSSLLHFLFTSTEDGQRLAALHCALAYLTPESEVELQIIHWICDNVMSYDRFDQIQEFMLTSLYRRIWQQSVSLDKVLPYSSISHWEEEIPGVKITTELLSQPVFRGKTRHLKGYWEELQWNIETMKYFEAVPNLRYRTTFVSEEWNKLLAERGSEEKKPSNYLRNIQENTKKVLSTVDTWHLDKKLVPLFQEEDHQQRVLIGLMVDKLREHLNRHLHRLGKKRIDGLVVNYVAQLLELVRRILETLWVKFNLRSQLLCFKQQGSPAEWAVFHVMSRVLEAAKGLCLPLPPGFNSLLTVLGLRCLPTHTFLQYLDHGILQLTEPFVMQLFKELDNSDQNEELKFSIVKRLPESMGQKIYQLWDHPISSACIARNYVRSLFVKLEKKQGTTRAERDRSFFQSEFMPLSYLTKTLYDVEDQAVNPFKEQENVDAKFVEEIALKQTFLMLGFEDK